MRSHPAHPLAGRNAQLSRILGILRDLDRLGGVTLYELAERYGTTDRTIRRDLDALRDVGLPLVEEGTSETGAKRWRLDWRHKEKLTGLLDVSHYLALKVAMGQGGPARRTSALFAALEDLATRVEEALGPSERARLAAIEQCFMPWERNTYRAAPPDVFWPLVEAVAASRLCLITYHPVGAPREKTYTALPLRLFVHDGAPYAVCGFEQGSHVMVLNLQRLVRLKLLDQTASPPAGLDLDQWERSAFGIIAGGEPTTYRLRFDAAAAPYIRERTWHPSQSLVDTKGGVLLEFTCGESYEVTAWVASWKDHVVAEAPEALRAELRAMGRWLTKTYLVPKGRGVR